MKTDREKIVELMREAVRKWWLDGGDDSNIEYVADYLISKNDIQNYRIETMWAI